MFDALMKLGVNGIYFRDEENDSDYSKENYKQRDKSLHKIEAKRERLRKTLAQ